MTPDEWNDPDNHRCIHSTWQGPLVSGVTLQQFSDFITCRERFRYRWVMGLIEFPKFDEHDAFTEILITGIKSLGRGRTKAETFTAMSDRRSYLLIKYKDNHQELNEALYLAKHMLIVYSSWRSKVTKSPLGVNASTIITPTPVKLPSGRSVHLRSDMHRAMMTEGRLYSELTQVTEGDKLRKADYQPYLGTYLPIMFNDYTLNYWYPEAGLLTTTITRCSIIRRPQSEKYPLKATKSDTSPTSLLDRVVKRVKDSEDKYFLMLDNSELTVAQKDLFESRCLIPILEQMCDWWELIKSTVDLGAHNTGIHYLTPWGMPGLPEPISEYNQLVNGVGKMVLDEEIEELFAPRQ